MAQLKSWACSCLLCAITVQVASSCSGEGEGKLYGLWKSNAKMTFENYPVDNVRMKKFFRERLGKMFHYFGERRMVLVYNPRVDKEEVLRRLKIGVEIPLEEDGHIGRFRYSVKGEDKENLIIEKKDEEAGYLAWLFGSDVVLIKMVSSEKCYYVKSNDDGMAEYFCKVSDVE